MATGDDLDPGDATLPATGQGQARDYSQPGALKQAWDSWTSRPENNAALINFGLQMMQPVEAGQSRLGHFAQAVGAGLEAGGRTATTEEQRQQKEEEMSLKEREAARKERETGAYEQYVQGRGLRKLSPMEIELQTQRAFNNWAKTPAPLVGADNYVDMINKRHPPPQGGKPLTKADIMLNPQYAAEVKAMMRPQGDQYTGGILGGGTTMDTGAAGAPPGGRPVYDANGLKGYWVNGQLIPAQ